MAAGGQFRLQEFVMYLQFLSGLLDHYRIADVCYEAEVAWRQRLDQGLEREVIECYELGPLGVCVAGEVDWYVWEMRDAMVRCAKIDPVDVRLRDLETVIRIALHASMTELVAQEAHFQRLRESRNEASA